MCPALQQRLCDALRPRGAKKTDSKTDKKNHTERTVADGRMAIANHSVLLHPPRSRAYRNARRSPDRRSRQRHTLTTATPRTSPPSCCGR